MAGQHNGLPNGLSSVEAAQRLQDAGPNELPATNQHSLLRLFLQIAREPVFLLLFAAGAIYLVIGDVHEALLLLAFVVLVMFIVLSRQRKTEQVLAALQALASPRALALRDGIAHRIPGREVVVGDVLILEEGDRIAADGTLLDAHDLMLDESLLTGESVAVDKQVGATVFSGAMVTQGNGMMEVTATGAATAFGKIGSDVRMVESGKSPLQSEIAHLIRRFAFFGLLLSLLVTALFGWLRNDWTGGLLAGITLAMSILPEEFSVILVVFMALGAWRIAKSNVLTRHPPVIETLGAATVLCVDKTGTLTQNRMTVVRVVADGESFNFDQNLAGLVLTPAARDVIATATLASEIKPFDPMEQAFQRCSEATFPQWQSQHQGWQLVHEYAKSPAVLAVTHCWQVPGSEQAVVAAKGAPETMIRLCRLEPDQAALQMEQVKQLAAQGLRVLAVARGSHQGAWPAQADGFAFTWLGLVGLADPLRPGAAEAVAQCRRAGLRVVMITGDYPVTAQAIAQEAGLDANRILTGMQVDAATDVQLQKMVAEVQVFARTLPHQKLRLVQAFKAHRDIVAMTGDGVNDAPALKAAHIGISMGQRGSDVAREASSLVLLNDDFGALVQAVRLGRRIVDNLRKALRYVIGVHVPITGVAIMPLLTGSPLILTPAVVMFLEMIINPASSIVFESEHSEHDLMQRPPSKPGAPLFDSHNIIYALLQGLGLFSACVAVYFIGMQHEWPQGQLRAAVFVAMVTGNMAMIVVSRSDRVHLFTLLRRSNRAQWALLAGTVLALALVLGVPWLAHAFMFDALNWSQLAITLGMVALALCWLELVKALLRQRV